MNKAIRNTNGVKLETTKTLMGYFLFLDSLSFLYIHKSSRVSVLHYFYFLSPVCGRKNVLGGLSFDFLLKLHVLSSPELEKNFLSDDCV